MLAIAFLFFACASHGRRVQSSIEQVHPGLLTSSRALHASGSTPNVQSLLELNHSSRQERHKGNLERDVRVNVPDLLREARAKSTAVGAFNIYNLEGALAVMHAAEEVGVPAILQLHPASMEFGGTALIAACKDVAARSKVPIAIQLDHSSKEDAIVAALEAGVDAIMADGSHLPLEENRQWTAKMVKLAHSKGASVEAELGKLAGEEDGLSVPEVEARMTDPSVVADFLAATGVDALAVTIGNVHGKYASLDPKLDFDRLDRIRAAAGDVPLVLHGASGLPEATIQQAIERGCCKFNVNTEVRAAARKAIKDGSDKGLDILDLMKASVKAMVPIIAQKMRLFQSCCGNNTRC